MMITETPRKRIMSRLEELKKKRASWEPHWRDLADNMLPRRLRLNPQGEYERGDKLNGSIIDGTPMLAQRILSAGLMAGVSSPSDNWFKLTTRDPDLKDFWPVKQYLQRVEERLRWILALSNFYQAVASGTYPDLGVFGTAAMIMDEHPTRIISCYAMPMGEYYLAVNGEGDVDTCYRDIPMTVRQIVTRFCGDGNLSRLTQSTRNAYTKGNYEDVRRVLHVIDPNDEFQPGKALPGKMAWRSLWLERDCGNEERYLYKGGYEEFPVMAPRWSTTGHDPYGRGPGMDALGDCKELQHERKRRGRMVDKVADPPMKASAGLRGSRATLIPGDVTYMGNEPNAMFEPSMTIDPRAMQEVRDGLQDGRSFIHRTFYADLWLNILSDQRTQRATATEIEEGKQERMLQLGPVLLHLTPELLRPSVDRAYAIAERLGLMPDDPPEELQGETLQIEFISILHQAQKRSGLGAIRTVWDEAGRIAQFKPSVMDKMEADASIDAIADIVGAPPKIVLDADGVAQVRKVRAAEEEKAAQAQQAAALADGAAKLGKTPAPGPDNALGALLGGGAGTGVGAIVPPGGQA
jgi:hypothetical protein